MTHPAYTDISRFRAPYKNAYFSGYGQEGAVEPGAPPGAPPPPPPAEPPPPGGLQYPSIDQMTERGADGYRRLTPQWQGTINNILSVTWGVTPEGNQNFVDLVRLTAAEQASRSAYAWVQTQVTGSPKRVVLISPFTIQGLLKNDLRGLPKTLGFYAPDSDKLKEAKAPDGAIVLAGKPADATKKVAGEKDEFPLAAVGIAVGAVVVIGGIYMIARKKGAPAPRM